MVNGDFYWVSSAFLSEDIEDTCNCLNQCGVQTKNEDGTYKTFNEVMEQIYSLHVHERE
jgi:hypothetical protein